MNSTQRFNAFRGRDVFVLLFSERVRHGRLAPYAAGTVDLEKRAGMLREPGISPTVLRFSTERTITAMTWFRLYSSVCVDRK